MSQTVLFMQCLLLITILKNQFEFVYSETEKKRIEFSSLGIECASPCTTEGTNYFWCRLPDSEWDYCSISPLLDHKGNKCENKCGRHGKKYEWCWTKNGKWGYCSSKEGHDVYVKHFGSTHGKECSSTCGRHTGTWYYWCQTKNSTESKWDYCSPSKGRNYAGTECQTSCEKSNGTTYYWCNDKNGKWQYCSPVSTKFNGNCSPSPLRTSQTVPPPSSTIHNRVSRASPTSSSPVSPFRNDILENGNLCEKLVKKHLLANPTLKQIFPGGGGGPKNPVVEAWYSGEGEKKFPRIIHSRIFQHHKTCPHSTFAGTFNKQMELMNAREDDEKGHILTTKLCGPSDWYNFSPRSLEDRGKKSLYSLEERMSEMLDHNPCFYVDHWVILVYDGEKQRPGHFQLCYSFKDVVTHQLMSGPDAKLFSNE